MHSLVDGTSNQITFRHCWPRGQGFLVTILERNVHTSSSSQQDKTYTWLLSHRMASNTPNYRHIERHVTCPFDNSHSILPERLLKHIRKCKKNNEIRAESMLICPYSTTHYLKPEEFDEHVMNCYRQHALMRWFPNLRF